jgi:methanogenic corrinoid protein MtbC1
MERFHTLTFQPWVAIVRVPPGVSVFEAASQQAARGCPRRLTRQEGYMDLQQLSNAVVTGNAPEAEALTKAALAEGFAPRTIVNDGLIAAMGRRALRPR